MRIFLLKKLKENIKYKILKSVSNKYVARKLLEGKLLEDVLEEWNLAKER